MKLAGCVLGDRRAALDPIAAIQVLDASDRVLEIAEMMTGTGTEAARRNAQELLEAAHRGE